MKKKQQNLDSAKNMEREYPFIISVKILRGSDTSSKLI